MKEITTQIQHNTSDLSPLCQGFKWTEVGMIPEDWEIQRLDNFCSVYSGGTPSTTRQDFYGGHIPWITSGDLNARRITEVSIYLTQEGFDSSAAKMIESGDLVIALYGATAGVVAVTEIEAAINQAVLAIKTNRCNSEYLFHHLARRKNQIVATYTQGGQPNLSGEIIRSLIIFIPPLEEQCAIAEVLSDVDGLINALDALIAKNVPSSKPRCNNSSLARHAYLVSVERVLRNRLLISPSLPWDNRHLRCSTIYVAKDYH